MDGPKKQINFIILYNKFVVDRSALYYPIRLRFPVDWENEALTAKDY